MNLQPSLKSTRPAAIRPGLLYMAAAAFFFSIMSLLVKVAGKTFPVGEVVFARSLTVLLISAALVRASGLSAMGRRRGLLLLRSLLGFAALMCFYFAITVLPLAEVTVIQYTNPVFAGLLAAWLLEERVGRREGMSTLLSMVGVLLVARPGFLGGLAAVSLDPAHVGVALAGAVLSGGAYVCVRALGASEDPMVIVLWFAAFSTVASAPMLAADAVMPSGIEWLLLAGLGVATHLGQIYITKGLQLEPAGRATSVGYLQIVFAAIWGMIFFSEVPGLLGVAGAALIIVSTWMLARSGPSTAIRVGVSSCLLGQDVRWDGGNKRNEDVLGGLTGRFELIGSCPEDGAGLGTPREPMRLQVAGGPAPALVGLESGRDLTGRVASWTDSRLDRLEEAGISGYILKSRSPSCGLDVPVHEDGAVRSRGGGLFARALLERFPGLPVIEEDDLADPTLRQAWIRAVEAYATSCR